MTENSPLPRSLILAFCEVHYNAVEIISGANNTLFGDITKLNDKHIIYLVYENINH